MGHLVDGRELHPLVAHAVGATAKHVVDPDTSHERVGGEVGLELTVGRPCGEVAHTHDLRVEPVKSHGIENEPFCHELRVDVLVAKILSHIEPLFGIHFVLAGFYAFAHPQATRTGGGDVYEACACLYTEFHATLCAADVHVLYLCSLAEVLHDGGTVEHGVDVQVGGDGGEVVGHIAKDDMQTCALQVFESIGEIVVEQCAETALCLLLTLPADEAVDVGSIRVDESAEDMYAQVSCGTREEHIAQSLSFSLAEVAERVALQQVVDGGVVEAGHLICALIGTLTSCLSDDEACQLPWGGVGKDVAVGHVEPRLVGLDDDTCHHE